MKTSDQISTIKATLLYILNHFPQGVDYIKLFKILYFAQQDHLVKYARPIVEDSFCALKHGPVPSFTYKALQYAEGKFPITEDINNFLNGIEVTRTSDNINVKASIASDLDELSISDRKCLDTSIAKNKDINSYDLSDLSHNEAWEEAYSRAQDDPEKNKMTLLDIAKSGHANKEMLDIIREHQLIKRSYLA